MPRWLSFSRDVEAALRADWEETREAEADTLTLTLDMTPEGFVREWDRQGRRSTVPLAAWEHAYNRVGLIERASDKGYIRIGRDVTCTITLEHKGRSCLPMPSDRPKTTDLVAQMCAAARAAIAARDEAVNGFESGKARLDALERWRAAEQESSSAEDRVVDAYANAR